MNRVDTLVIRYRYILYVCTTHLTRMPTLLEVVTFAKPKRRYIVVCSLCVSEVSASFLSSNTANFYSVSPWFSMICVLICKYVCNVYMSFSSCPLLGSSLPYWGTGLITQFIDLSQSVGLLGRAISSSQGLYLNTGQHKYRNTRTYIKHPCPRRDSNPESRLPSDWRLFMPQTARLPRLTCVCVSVCEYLYVCNVCMYVSMYVTCISDL
jgi:hypothetical protein